MIASQRIHQFIQLAAIALVVVGCYEVLHPFIPALLFALVVCISTWPIYLRLRQAFHGRSALAALLMVGLLVVLVIGPSALLAISLANDVVVMAESAKVLLSHGPVIAPPWLEKMPLVGEHLHAYWLELASGGDEAVMLSKQLLEPARDLLIGAGNAIGASLLQMVFAAFIGFFLYRDAEALIQALRNGLSRLAGDLGEELLSTIHDTVAGVVQGVFGTALAQAVVAVIGFLIAGVPGAFLLGAATFFLSLIPIGPPLLWSGASLWLFYQGTYGWAIFMLMWGILVISSIDNFVRPYLISRGSSLPMLPITLGVFGGVVAFGFIGIFIGPPILAVGLMLARLWTDLPKTIIAPSS